jgi:hypothetical protein
MSPRLAPLILFAALSASIPAAADDPDPPPVEAADEGPPLGLEVPPPVHSVIGLVGGAAFSGGLSSEVEPGPGYGVLYNLTPARIAGVELAYQGSINNVNTVTGGQLVTNQFSGVLRINFVPPQFPFWADLTPFICTGAAWQRVTTLSFIPGISSVNAFAIPLAGGLEASLGRHFVVGGRFTWNFLINVARAFNGRSANDWLATIDLGARFPE